MMDGHYVNFNVDFRVRLLHSLILKICFDSNFWQVFVIRNHCASLAVLPHSLSYSCTSLRSGLRATASFFHKRKGLVTLHHCY